MVLAITLRPEERVIINGCVLHNAGRKAVFYVESRADILRARDLISEAEARDPIRRIHFKLQQALIAPGRREGESPALAAALEDLLATAAEGAAPHLHAAARALAAGDYYQALVALRPLRDRGSDPEIPPRENGAPAEKIPQDLAIPQNDLRSAEGRRTGKPAPGMAIASR